MPVGYRIEPAARLVVSRGWGTMRADDLMAHTVALARDQRFAPSFHQIFQTADVTRVEGDSQALGRVADNSAFGPGARRAVVAPTDLLYGMARAFEQQKDDRHGEMTVFRTLAEAAAYLKLSEEDLSVWLQAPLEWTAGED